MARDLAAVWRRVFDEHASGAGTMGALCAKHGVSKGAWYYWRRRIGSAPKGFAELVVQGAAPPSGHCAVEVALPSGAVVRVHPGAGEREVALALRALGAC